MAQIFKAKTFFEIYDAMRRWMVARTSTLTNFNVGSRVSALLEAVAMVVSQAMTDFKQSLKTAIRTSVYNSFRFAAKAGLEATGQLTFRVGSPAGSTIPIAIGSSVVYNGFTYQTTVAGQITAGDTSSGGIAAQCSESGSAANIAISTIDTNAGNGAFAVQPPGVEYATNEASAFTGGEDVESDADRAARFTTFANGLVKANRPGIESGVLSVTGVKSVTVRNWFPAEGWITIYADDGTGVLSPAQKAEIEKIINGDPIDPANYPGYRAAGIRAQVLAPTIQAVSVAAVISILDTSSADPAALKAACKAAIENYINTLRLGQDVILATAKNRGQDADPEIYDITISSPATNVVIDIDKIARTGGTTGGTVTVTHVTVSE